MKKILITVVIFVSILILAIVYLEYPYITYVNRTIKLYTKIDNFIIDKKIHNDHEWYAKIMINEHDGEKLLKRYPFKCCYTKKVIAGMVQQDYIDDCGNCFYFLDAKGYGQYGYVLYCLSQDKKQLEIYQPFGE